MQQDFSASLFLPSGRRLQLKMAATKAAMFCVPLLRLRRGRVLQTAQVILAPSPVDVLLMRSWTSTRACSCPLDAGISPKTAATCSTIFGLQVFRLRRRRALLAAQVIYAPSLVDVPLMCSRTSTRAWCCLQDAGGRDQHYIVLFAGFACGADALGRSRR